MNPENTSLNTENYQAWKETSSDDFKKKLISDFVQHSINYAEDHVKKRILELETAPAGEIPERQARLDVWLGYIEFQKHTLKELEEGRIKEYYA